MDSNVVELKNFSEETTALIFVPYTRNETAVSSENWQVCIRKHGVTSQKAVFIVTVVRSSNMTQ